MSPNRYKGGSGESRLKKVSNKVVDIKVENYTLIIIISNYNRLLALSLRATSSLAIASKVSNKVVDRVLDIYIYLLRNLALFSSSLLSCADKGLILL